MPELSLADYCCLFWQARGMDLQKTDSFFTKYYELWINSYCFKSEKDVKNV
jgi:hypothetical protein